MDGEESAPTEVFDLMSNPTRIEILQTLASAYNEAPMDPWLEYSELQAAVGIRDNGNFNYHLDQLDDLVVRDSAGYRLSRVGMQFISAISSGVFDPEWTWGPVDAPGSCFFCEDSLQLRFEDGTLRLTCGTDEHALALGIPPSLLDSGPEEDVIERIAFLENRWGQLTRQGICGECSGYVDGEVELGEKWGGHYTYHGICGRCGFHHGIPVGMFLVSHPAVCNFYDERGVDVRTTPFWTLDFCKPGTETVVSRDPLRLRVDVRYEGETLSLTLDREGSVVSTERSRSAATTD